MILRYCHLCVNLKTTEDGEIVYCDTFGSWEAKNKDIERITTYCSFYAKKEI